MVDDSRFLGGGSTLPAPFPLVDHPCDDSHSLAKCGGPRTIMMMKKKNCMTSGCLLVVLVLLLLTPHSFIGSLLGGSSSSLAGPLAFINGSHFDGVGCPLGGGSIPMADTATADSSGDDSLAFVYDSPPAVDTYPMLVEPRLFVAASAVSSHASLPVHLTSLICCS
jgi:hypothetical protein